MGLRLTLDMFSGRPNPEVELDDRDAERWLERLTPEARIGEEDLDLPPTPTLGYRGVVIEQTGDPRPELPRRFRLAGGQLFGRGLAHRPADPRAEDEICGSTGPFRPHIPDDVFERLPLLRDEFLEVWRKYLVDFPFWWLPESCQCGPVFEPGWWNVAPRQYQNNCYNYASNYRTDSFAQPGLAAGAQYTALTCAEVRRGAIADCLVDGPDEPVCPAQGHLVALVVAPGYDFHWYRKDKRGWWSHKPGGTAATDRDNAGHLIRDPRAADRGPYTDFCGFMIVQHGHIKIR
jgi:hypothetical protein